MTAPVRKVVVVGRDADAWLSAHALQRSFGRRDDPVQVELVELPSLLRPQDAYVTLPTQKAFHNLLGFDETRLLRACSGVYALAQRFSNWSGSEAPFLHAYDTHGVSLSHIDFFQYWVKARASGLNVPLEEFSLGAVAAKQGRFVVFNESTESFSRATYGYHLDAIRYVKAVARTALESGLRHTVGDVADVHCSDGRIRSLQLGDGTIVEADLFVDASGADATLIRHLDPGGVEDWSRWLPCNRIMVASGPALTPIPAFSQVSAFRSGWVGLFPLMNRTAIVAVYDGAAVDDTEMHDTLTVLTGMRLDGDVVASPFAAGGRDRHWIGNCVALGDAAAALEPLDAVQLHLLHTGVSYLVSLFPVDRDQMPEAGIFNDKMRAHAVGLRDFQVSHYKLNRRHDEPLWDRARDAESPATLARKLGLFSRRGAVAMDEHETFQEENWTSIFVGHRLLPTSWDPLVDATPEQEQIANFQKILGFIADEVREMPSLQAHIELNSPQATSDYVF